MAKALNDTLGVKRAIKHFDFSEPYWEGDETEETHASSIARQRASISTFRGR